MNDEFLDEHREEPRPEFARALRQKLRAQEEEPVSPPQKAPWRLATAGLATAACVAVLLAIPSVRATAQQFLDIFRVQRVAAVPTDFQRLDRLSQAIDMKAFLGDQMQVLIDPGPSQALDNFEAAQGVTGLTLRKPSMAPGGVTGPDVRLRGEGLFKITADMSKVENVLDALALDDVAVPWEANGAVFTVKSSPVVDLVYHRDAGSCEGECEIVFTQTKSPEVELPPGVDLAKLGEVALRIQGLSATEARQFAKTLDWSSTLVVPVPIVGSEYREVDVDGTKGVLVTYSRNPRRKGAAASASAARLSALVWTSGGTVYRLRGRATGRDLLQMAASIK